MGKTRTTAAAAGSPSASSTPIYFWKTSGPVGYLSQWYPARFVSATIPPQTYTSTEQYMMHRKALLFTSPSDPIALAILATDDPDEIKKLGRRVGGFDEAAWKREREGIVEEGNYLKFSQDARLKGLLLGTGERELVEASPFDRIWGIGFAPDKADEGKRHMWGLNLLGRALERVRARLRRETEEEERQAAADAAANV